MFESQMKDILKAGHSGKRRRRLLRKPLASSPSLFASVPSLCISSSNPSSLQPITSTALSSTATLSSEMISKTPQPYSTSLPPFISPLGMPSIQKTPPRSRSAHLDTTIPETPVVSVRTQITPAIFSPTSVAETPPMIRAWPSVTPPIRCAASGPKVTSPSATTTPTTTTTPASTTTATTTTTSFSSMLTSEVPFSPQSSPSFDYAAFPRSRPRFSRSAFQSCIKQISSSSCSFASSFSSSTSTISTPTPTITTTSTPTTTNSTTDTAATTAADTTATAPATDSATDSTTNSTTPTAATATISPAATTATTTTANFTSATSVTIFNPTIPALKELFSALCFWCVPGGKDLSKARCALLEDIIKKKGGVVYKAFSPCLTHIVMDRASIPLLGSLPSNSAVAVTPLWVTTCNTKRLLVDPAPYLVIPLAVVPYRDRRRGSPVKFNGSALSHEPMHVGYQTVVGETGNGPLVVVEEEPPPLEAPLNNEYGSDNEKADFRDPAQVEKLQVDNFCPVGKDGDLSISGPGWDPLSFQPINAIMPENKRVDRGKKYLACQLQSGAAVNRNAHLTKELERLEEIYSNIGDKWRTYSYRKAVGVLKRYELPIRTPQDIELLEKKEIKGLGKKMMEKIKEILVTGSLAKRKCLENDNRVQVLELFGKIHGVGGVTAQRWYDLGLRTLDDVKKSDKIELNETQKVGLEFFDDRLKRIPRAEVAAIEKMVRETAIAILNTEAQVICCGSYRRGKPTSGDCDILISYPDFEERAVSFPGAERERLKLVHNVETDLLEVPNLLHLSASSSALTPSSVGTMSVYQHKSTRPLNRFVFLEILLGTLRAQHLIRRDLTVHNRTDTSNHGQGSYMGFCMLPAPHPCYSGIHRRLDIKVYPSAHFPFALLYFTGSDHFNRSMRYYAKKKGWTLSDHGLAPAIRVAGTKVATGKSVYCKTERDIFDAMGLEYVPPDQRNCYEQFDAPVASEGQEVKTDASSNMNLAPVLVEPKVEELTDDEEDQLRPFKKEPTPDTDNLLKERSLVPSRICMDLTQGSPFEICRPNLIKEPSKRQKTESTVKQETPAPAPGLKTELTATSFLFSLDEDYEVPIRIKIESPG